jgi:hypothetical protein
MEKVHDRIWLGNRHDARNKDLLRQNGITAILTCAVDLGPCCHWYDGITVAHVPLIDNKGNHPSLYVAAINLLAALVTQHQVLVHCREGRSRSPLVVCLYLSNLTGKSFDQCEQDVKRIRPCVCINQELKIEAIRLVQ